MDKNTIKKFAIWARRHLNERVRERALRYGISPSGGAEDVESVNGRVLSRAERRERRSLLRRIRVRGYEAVMEEIAYTWFNRFCALRFMEVNDYLPQHVRVFTDEAGAVHPQLLTEALDLDLAGLVREEVIRLKEASAEEELYRYLLITLCNALSKELPYLFQTIEDYTELLLPDNLLREGNCISQMVEMIPEEEWRDQVQIIGWLYQYYNTEPKDAVFAALRQNKKITKEKIPAATQLFTPDWIVRYMVENSLGRLYIEQRLLEEGFSGTESERREREREIAQQMHWRYYLPEAEQSSEVRKLLAQQEGRFNTQQLRLIDPCCGSGHILAYMFDVLMEIYSAQGYSTRDAVRFIVQHNLAGLDIDERAAQLAYFAIMMKGRQYDKRFFTRGYEPQIVAIAESNEVEAELVKEFATADKRLEQSMNTIVRELRDAKEYGSLLSVTAQDWGALHARMEQIEREDEDEGRALPSRALQLRPLIRTAQLLAQRYDVVVTNPPYMGGAGMGPKLTQFVRDRFPASKSDLFACFITRGNAMVKPLGYNCMVTMQSWMFLSSFEKMRETLLQSKTITNLMHMENMVLGIAFGTAVTVFRNIAIKDYKGTYNHIKLKDIVNDIPREFPVKGNRFAQVSTDNFAKIPGAPIAYWVSEKVMEAFEKGKIGDYGNVSNGFTTGDNEKFLRLWYEVAIVDINFSAASCEIAKLSRKVWFPYNKGGAYRKWYGNNDYVINWKKDG